MAEPEKLRVGFWQQFVNSWLPFFSLQEVPIWRISFTLRCADDGIYHPAVMSTGAGVTLAIDSRTIKSITHRPLAVMRSRFGAEDVALPLPHQLTGGANCSSTTCGVLAVRAYTRGPRRIAANQCFPEGCGRFTRGRWAGAASCAPGVHCGFCAQPAWLSALGGRELDGLTRARIYLLIKRVLEGQQKSLKTRKNISIMSPLPQLKPPVLLVCVSQFAGLSGVILSEQKMETPTRQGEMLREKSCADGRIRYFRVSAPQAEAGARDRFYCRNRSGNKAS